MRWNRPGRSGDALTHPEASWMSWRRASRFGDVLDELVTSWMSWRRPGWVGDAVDHPESSRTISRRAGWIEALPADLESRWMSRNPPGGSRILLAEMATRQRGTRQGRTHWSTPPGKTTVWTGCRPPVGPNNHCLCRHLQDRPLFHVL